MDLLLPTVDRKSVCGQRCNIVYFFLGSLLLHVLVGVLCCGEPPAGPVGRSTFEITLVTRHGDTSEQPGVEREQAEDHEPRPSSNSSTLSSKPSKPVEDAKQQPLLSTEPAESSPSTARIVYKMQHDKRRPVKSARKPQTKTAVEEQHRTTNPVEAFEQRRVSTRRGATTHGPHELTSAARYHRIRDELLQALLPHFKYPPVARRRGWQGRVRIGLRVEADGHLSGVHLVESSGYALLDKAAIKNVNQLRNIPGVTRWLDGRDMGVILPVKYRLEDR